jgi:hypothetical protein
MAPLTFATIDLSKHPKAFEDGLVLGFATFNYVEGKETLYALKADGSMHTTGERKALPTFRNKTWTKVDEIPANAEFIGNYYLMR